MADARALAAIERIERALARIEAAAQPSHGQFDDSEYRALRERHEALRSRVEGAVAQIDRMIQAAEPS